MKPIDDQELHRLEEAIIRLQTVLPRPVGFLLGAMLLISGFMFHFKAVAKGGSSSLRLFIGTLGIGWVLAAAGLVLVFVSLGFW